MDSVATYWADRALLAWQVELGADEAMLDAPLDRYALATDTPKVAAKAEKPTVPLVPVQVAIDPVAAAQAAAAGASDLGALNAALEGFMHCAMRKGARKTVFATGQPAARVMIIGDVPDRDEDRTGLPFAGPQGQLLDKMLAAIGLDRDAKDPAQAVYLTTGLPWRTPGDAQPRPEDIAMLRPFLERHVALAAPDIVVLMGAMASEILLGNGNISRLRGKWGEAMGRPTLPMLHPSALMRTPLAKRDAWADLLALQARLREMG